MSTYFFAIKPADEVIQMAIYTIGMNGSEIFNGWNKVEPKLHMELNSAGYLEFIDPLPNSTSEYAIQTDTYVVYEEGVPIFQGRPADSTRLYNNRVKQYIEGCYAYFNDSVVKPFVYQSSISYDDSGGAELSANDMLAYIIRQHNAQVAQNRQIQLGTVTVTGTLYRKFNYESCLQALSNLRDELGGYMVMSYSNDGYTAYLNWYSTLPNSTGQTVELGKNITDLSEKLAMSGVPTVLIPLGNEIEMIDEETQEQPADDTHILASDTAHLYLVGQRLTLCNRTDVNQGLDYLTNSLTEVLGYQCESKTFDAGSAMELLAMANAYWARKVLQVAFLDVDVADLHYANGYQLTNDAIKFATNVSVSANKYVPPISATLPCSVMDIELDNAVKSIALGTLKRDDLSDTIKRDNDDRTATDDNLQEQIDNLDKAIGQGGGGGGGEPTGGANILNFKAGTKFLPKFLPSDMFVHGIAFVNNSYKYHVWACEAQIGGEDDFTIAKDTSIYIPDTGVQVEIELAVNLVCNTNSCSPDGIVSPQQSLTIHSGGGYGNAVLRVLGSVDESGTKFNVTRYEDLYYSYENINSGSSSQTYHKEAVLLSMYPLKAFSARAREIPCTYEVATINHVSAGTGTTVNSNGAVSVNTETDSDVDNAIDGILIS